VAHCTTSAQLGDRRLEVVEVVLGGEAELDGAVDLEAQAQQFAVQDGHAALDDAGILKALDPAPAGAGGQSDPLGDLRDGQAGVMLDEIQNLSIDGVEGLRQVFLPHLVLLRLIRAPERLSGGTPLASNCSALI
jgi:hypothetical protein